MKTLCNAWFLLYCTGTVNLRQKSMLKTFLHANKNTRVKDNRKEIGPDFSFLVSTALKPQKIVIEANFSKMLIIKRTFFKKSCSLTNEFDFHKTCTECLKKERKRERKKTVRKTFEILKRQSCFVSLHSYLLTLYFIGGFICKYFLLYFLFLNFSSSVFFN